jgi:thymidylate kinase
MERVPMIHFFGPDGAGKTTQVARLAAYLESVGIPTYKTWVRSPHTLAYVAMVSLYRLGLRHPLYNPAGQEFSRPRIDGNRTVQTLWIALELLSVAPVVVREAIIPRLRGRTLVAERYLLDSVATIAYFLQDETFIDSWPARLLYRLVPRNTLLVYLDADYANVLDRRGDTAEPEVFIEFQRRVYKIMAERMRALVIYTPDRTIEETHALICSALESRERYLPARPSGGAVS